MESRRKRSGSGDIFSFPSTPTPDQDSDDFEFGSITPDSPSTDPYKNSPADHLFFNGRLLPHSFPIQPPNISVDNSRTTSRTSSISSKDSLRSSRSNSTNSRSSSCSSGRTSSSDNSERKLLYQSKFSSTTPGVRDRYQAQVYGSSQRWQYITPVPFLSREPSRRKKMEVVGKEGISKKQAKKERKEAGSWPAGRRFFWWFVSACKECHAMEPSRKDDVYLRGNLKLQ
ncbi:uncharacterized protein LOC132176418 [Corylus avellana]|uniref:uncharacterized protein LOC132176418 n=1 Tax=Corylus avellana TaxID=13451 RepID=UPI001E23EDB9|nr:uncharacterized protein LOC132176418 [Corylus avellana]